MAVLQALVFALLLIVARHAWAEELPAVPDPALTPGVVASTDEAEVCAAGPNGTYSQQHRQTTVAMKAEVYRRYNVEPAGRDFEIDHRLPLALGGKDDVLNLWPQRGFEHPSYHDKDKLETYLWRAVCKDHKMHLGDAQSILLGDWIAGFVKFFGEPPQ